MIVLTKFQRREINAGRRVDLRLSDKPTERAGHSYAVLAAAEKGKTRSRTSLRVEVIASAQVEDGWVMSLKMAPQQRRLLHRDSSHGYTENAAMALQGEPEAVDEFTQERISRQADENADQQAFINRCRREQHELDQRLARAREDAAARGVDISSPERVIERQVAKIERRVYEGRAA